MPFRGIADEEGDLVGLGKVGDFVSAGRVQSSLSCACVLYLKNGHGAMMKMSFADCQSKAWSEVDKHCLLAEI